MNRSVSIALLALVIGCSAGVALRDSVAPIAGAQVNGSAFQHQCVELKWEEVLGVQDLKPELGGQGWELTTFVSAEKKGGWGPTTRIVACFKRQVAGG